MLFGLSLHLKFFFPENVNKNFSIDDKQTTLKRNLDEEKTPKQDNDTTSCEKANKGSSKYCQ